MNYCCECGEKMAENLKYCVKCGRKVGFERENCKRIKVCASLGMATSLCLGIFLGSRNWNFFSQNPIITTESIQIPFIPYSDEPIDSTAQEVRFIPEITLTKMEHNEKNPVIQDEFLLKYAEDEVILLEYIGKEAEITLPDQVTTIAAEAFMKNDVIRKVTLPTSLTVIEEDAFAYCLLLEEINWSQQVLTLEDGSFRHCESLSLIELPDSLVEIGADAFYGCENLKVLHMGKAVTEIGEAAFKNCWNLEEITLSQNLRVLPRAVVENCASLSQLTIPESVVNIEDNLFSTCFSLKKVRVKKGSYGETYVNEWLTEVEVEFY